VSTRMARRLVGSCLAAPILFDRAMRIARDAMYRCVRTTCMQLGRGVVHPFRGSGHFGRLRDFVITPIIDINLNKVLFLRPNVTDDECV
jgi:hypothetical protein